MVVGDVLVGDLDLLGVALDPLVDQVDDELRGRILLLEDGLVVVDADLGGVVLLLGDDDLVSAETVSVFKTSPCCMEAKKSAANST